jgi:SAM-dependent methyltransferase
MSTFKTRLIEEHFFRPRWYSVFLNPYFINRFTLYRGIQTFAAHTKADATILDVGCGLKPYQNLFLSQSYTGIDIAGGGHADTAKVVDAFYDGLSIPFADKSFDTLICTQVLEHATDPDRLVAECARVLRSGGRAFFSMPFTYPEHEIPYDFRRFTSFEHKRLFAKYGFTNITITKTTGFCGTFAQLFIVWVFESIPFRSTILKSLLTAGIFAPIQMVGLAFDWLTRKSGMTMDYSITLES